MSNSHHSHSSIFRDPVSGLTHLAGAALALLATIYLTYASRNLDTRIIASMLTYGVSMVLLYLASATYHLPHVSDSVRLTLRRIDHAMIPLFIAGSYTPFCVVALNSTLGYSVLGAIWILTLAGIIKSIYWIHAPRWVSSGVYVLMGWVSVIMIKPLWHTLSFNAFGYLILGGISYSVGALVYAKKWPDPWPPHFGFHEIWHLFVLGGSIFHFAAIATLI